jgi:hypothetical protein
MKVTETGKLLGTSVACNKLLGTSVACNKLLGVPIPDPEWDILRRLDNRPGNKKNRFMNEKFAEMTVLKKTN